MKRPLIFIALILATVLAVTAVSQRASADVMGYAVDTGENLYSVNLTSASATLIGNTNTGLFLEGLAISPGGGLFGTADSGNLYSINKSTGAATLIGDTGLGDIEGLDYNVAILLGTDLNTSTTTFYSINTTTATPTAVVSTGKGITRAMAVQNPTTAYITIDTPVYQGRSLVSVNLTTGANTFLGTLSQSIGAMDFDPLSETLYGLTSTGDDVIINQADGSLTLVGNTGGQFWLDLTIPTIPAAPAVPEPSSLLLLGSGLAGLAAWRRRQAA